MKTFLICPVRGVDKKETEGIVKLLENSGYTDIASWCNQPGLFKNMPFEEFLSKRTKKQARIDSTLSMWNNKNVS